MKKPSARELAIDIAERSICAVQVGAVLSDTHGIFAWGWNNGGDGFGEHAEQMALKRANRKRLKGAVITIASFRRRNGKPVLSLPCKERCAGRIEAVEIGTIEYLDGNGRWHVMEAA